MSLIPDSGKPVDLVMADIMTASQAETVIDWLDDCIDDMRSQVLGYFMSNTQDETWLAKVKTAIRNTIKTKYRVLDMLRAMTEGESRAEMFVREAEAYLDPDQIAAIWAKVGAQTPSKRHAF